MKKIIYLILIVWSSLGFAQRKDSLPNFEEQENMSINLDVVTILPKHKFNSVLDKNYYYWFRKKVFKAYPYAVIASRKLDSLNLEIKNIKSKRKRRRYVKKVQKEVEKELTDRLKKLTKTEGRILIKLIHRQTGNTAYENIKNLRSGFKAFLYNIQANLFRMSLKDTYQPEKVNEDFLIEDVLQRAFNSELLEEQNPKLDIDSDKIVSLRNEPVNVEKYKKMFEKKRKRKNK